MVRQHKCTSGYKLPPPTPLYSLCREGGYEVPPQVADAHPLCFLCQLYSRRAAHPRRSFGAKDVRRIAVERLPTRTIKRIDPELMGHEDRFLQAQAQCPGCDAWGDVDADQLEGRVSLVCSECDWHGYIGGNTA